MRQTPSPLPPSAVSAPGKEGLWGLLGGWERWGACPSLPQGPPAWASNDPKVNAEAAKEAERPSKPVFLLAWLCVCATGRGRKASLQSTPGASDGLGQPATQSQGLSPAHSPVFRFFWRWRLGLGSFWVSFSLQAAQDRQGWS